MFEVKLSGGAPIEVEVSGAGPAVMLLVDPRPATGDRADELRRWGVDPRLGRTLCEGLRDRFRVIAVPYEAHALAHPRPDALTPDTIAADLLAIADAAGADRFACYGYSWLALAAQQLALRTGRLAALAMGGFPPLDGPYPQMLAVTAATHEMAVAAAARPREAAAAQPGTDWDSAEVTLSPAQTRQFVTLYRALEGFDDHAALARVTCPRLCFAGSADRTEYGPRWGGVVVDIAGPLRRHEAQLRAAGWSVCLLDGLDHIQAMQPQHALPVLRPWLSAVLLHAAQPVVGNEEPAPGYEIDRPE
jgi:pimeloyl-ACP methyl ester carboxylesterase